MEEKFLKLTNTVYKVLEFFPESDPLKSRAKDRALSIIEGLFLIYKSDVWTRDKIKAQILDDIDILLGYLWIAKSQGWLNQTNCLIISNEYEKIRNSLNTKIELTQKLPGIEEKPKTNETIETKKEYNLNRL